MSEFEKINVSAKVQMAAMRKEAIKRVILELAKVLLAIGVFVGLEAIGFISTMFLVILAAITICVGAFKTGYICRDIKF